MEQVSAWFALYSVLVIACEKDFFHFYLNILTKEEVEKASFTAYQAK